MRTDLKWTVDRMIDNHITGMTSQIDTIEAEIVEMKNDLRDSGNSSKDKNKTAADKTVEYVFQNKADSEVEKLMRIESSWEDKFTQVKDFLFGLCTIDMNFINDALTKVRTPRFTERISDIVEDNGIQYYCDHNKQKILEQRQLFDCESGCQNLKYLLLFDCCKTVGCCDTCHYRSTNHYGDYKHVMCVRCWQKGEWNHCYC